MRTSDETDSKPVPILLLIISLLTLFGCDNTSHDRTPIDDESVSSVYLPALFGESIDVLADKFRELKGKEPFVEIRITGWEDWDRIAVGFDDEGRFNWMYFHPMKMTLVDDLIRILEERYGIAVKLGRRSEKPGLIEYNFKRGRIEKIIFHSTLSGDRATGVHIYLRVP